MCINNINEARNVQLCTKLFPMKFYIPNFTKKLYYENFKLYGSSIRFAVARNFKYAMKCVCYATFQQSNKQLMVTKRSLCYSTFILN